MTKKKVTDPLKLEWDAKKGKVTRTCRVCLKPFAVTHWKQTICEEPVCKDYSFRFAHIRASYKRWEEIVKDVKALGLKPSFAFTISKEVK